MQIAFKCVRRRRKMKKEKEDVRFLLNFAMQPAVSFAAGFR